MSCQCRSHLICRPCGAAETFPAYSVVQNGAPLEVVDWPMPTPKGNEVLVRTKYAGVCHSDLHLIDGYFDLGAGQKMPTRQASRDDPFTVGHEFEGVIIAAGENVPMDQFDTEKSYAIFPWIGCDLPEECPQCASGNSNLCNSPKSQRFIDGKSQYGGYASHILVPHYKYLIDYTGILPEGLGCVYMCSGLTAFSALEAAYTSRNPPQRPEDLVILGCGGLGFQALVMATARYGAPLACDVMESKLLEAEKLGCRTFNAAQKESIMAIHDLNGGAAVVIDFVGNEKSHKFAMSILRRGGKVLNVGLMGGKLELPLVLLAVQQWSLEGSMVGNLRQARDMLRFIQEKNVPVVPHHFRSIFEVNSAIKDLSEGNYVGRCILKHDWVGPEKAKM